MNIEQLVEICKTDNPILSAISMSIVFLAYHYYNKHNLKSSAAIADKVLSEDDVKTEVIIDKSFDLLAYILYDDISKIIINNHVDSKKELIKSNIAGLIIARYYEIYHGLLPFRVDALRKDWIKDIEQLILDHVFSNDDQHTKLESLKRNLVLKTHGYKVYLKNKNSHFEKT